MESAKRSLKWTDYLIRRAKVIVNHGQGKLTINVGPFSSDKTSILIECGEAEKFIIERFVDDLED